MAKKKKPKARKAPKASEVPTPVEPMVINRLGPTRGREIKKAKVVPSTFTLDDNTQILVTPRIGDVRRAIGQYNHDGEPLYFLAIGYSIQTKAPKKLLRKIKKTKKS